LKVSGKGTCYRAELSGTLQEGRKRRERKRGSVPPRRWLRERRGGRLHCWLRGRGKKGKGTLGQEEERRKEKGERESLFLL